MMTSNNRIKTFEFNCSKVEFTKGLTKTFYGASVTQNLIWTQKN